MLFSAFGVIKIRLPRLIKIGAVKYEIREVPYATMIELSGDPKVSSIESPGDGVIFVADDLPEGVKVKSVMFDALKALFRECGAELDDEKFYPVTNMIIDMVDSLIEVREGKKKRRDGVSYIK